MIAFSLKPKLTTRNNNKVSIWFHRMEYRGRAEDVEALLTDVFQQIGIKKPTRKQSQALQQLLFNLLRVGYRYPDKWLRICLGREYNDSDTEQYQIFGCSGYVLGPLVHGLHGAGIIDLSTGYKIDNKGETSKMKLKDTSLGAYLNPSLLKCVAPETPVTFKQKGVNKVVEPFNTKEDCSVLRKYNRLLSNTSVSCRGVVLEDSQLYYVRKFADKGCTSGGRLYAGWQSLIHGDYRQYIRIDGSDTRELDIKSCDLMLTYARLGYDITEEEEDLYHIDLLAPVWGYSEARKLTKAIIIRALNVQAKSRKALVCSLVNSIQMNEESHQVAEFVLSMYRRTTGQNIALKDVVGAILDKHSRIAEYLGGGHTWYLSQFTESNILLDVITYAVGEGVPILTIHDGIVVKVEDVDIIKSVWIEAIKRHTGIDFKHPDRLITIE